MKRLSVQGVSVGTKRHQFRVSWFSIAALVAVAVLCVNGLLAQNPPAASAAVQGAAASAPSPNYELAARFMPERVNKLVFDVAVTPHWFELSDRFWYSYETPDGTHYWIVDPAKKSKTPLWDNAKVAVTLAEMLNIPYDAQHLPVKNLKLTKKDTVVYFEVDVSKDDVIPNDTKKTDTDTEQQENQQQNTQQNTQTQGGRRGGRGGAPTPENARTLYFEYDLATGKITRSEDAERALKKPTWATISPDEKTVIFARGNNLYMMSGDDYKKAQKNPADSSITETQITTDGVDRYSYARVLLPEDQDQLKKDDKGDADNKNGMRTPPTAIHWSKDSKKFALVRRDERKVGQLWVIHTLAQPRPILETYSYSMPGEDNVALSEIQIWDVASKQRIMVQPKKFVDETLAIESAPLTSKEREETGGRGGGGGGVGGPATSRWLADTSDKLYFTAMKRNFRQWDVLVADTSTGNVRTILEDSSNVWMDSRPLRSINNGQQILWWSERDGWGHYFRYDDTGKLLGELSPGEFMADQIVSVDEKASNLYFTANGREAGEDPYYSHLYSSGLDGSNMKLLTPGNFTHAVSAPDSGKYFVDTYSRVDTAPKSILCDQNGNQVMELETTDIKRLMDAGYKMPEIFHVKAADGITDLHGLMFKPFDFDPNKKYPVILYVYPGPQTESVAKGFAAKAGADEQNVALAQLGFIVVEVGARGGSPQRDKWYDSYGYGNMRDYGLADKKAAVEELAALHPYIDIDRVGIWGHSGGGFMTAASLLQYPDFFKVGWSESGNHDNNVYNTTWSEKYHGVKEETEKDGTEKFLYNIDKNSEIAKNLKGHLMLTSGDMDNNVHMANTMRLADALIKADKRFEMLIFPGMRHPYTPIQDYVLMRRMDFFAHWLLGSNEDSADIIELQRERQATPSTGHNLGEGVGGGRGRGNQ